MTMSNLNWVRATLLAAQREDKRVDRALRDEHVATQLDLKRSAARLTEEASLEELGANTTKAGYELAGGVGSMTQSGVGGIISPIGTLATTETREEVANLRHRVSRIEAKSVLAQKRTKDAEDRIDATRHRSRQVLETVRSISKERSALMAAALRA